MDEGLAVLAEHGVAALRIDRLAARLGLSKGSFYHHFAGMPGYRQALLEHYEASRTTHYIDLANAASGLDDSTDGTAADPAGVARARLRRLQDLVVAGHGASSDLEVAVRAWSALDPEARATMQRVDATRLGYLRDRWTEITGDPALAADVARLTYLVLIGAEHLAPPLPAADLARLFDRLSAGIPYGTV